MNALAYVAMLGFVPAMLALFAVLPGRTATLITAIGGWLFLPQASIPLSGLPNLDKYSAISVALLLGVVLFDSRRIAHLRVGWIDLPVLGWILSALFSALANETGWYDGLATSFDRVLAAAVPYLVGRIYFADADGARILLRGCLLGGIAYVLPVAFELRMSPQLHNMFYGFGQHAFGQTLRGSGYRPMVFTPHGLALTFWMAVATLAAFTLWRARRDRTVLGVPLPAWIAVLATTTVLCKSFGSLLLMVIGFAALRWARPWLNLVLLTAMLGYLTARIGATEWVHELLETLLPWLPEERAGSLQFRVDNEEILLERAWSRPWCGWTGWYFVVPIVDEHETTHVLISDSMWIIAFAANGFIGLVSYVGMLTLPSVVALWNRLVRGRHGLDEHFAIATVLLLFLGDCLANNFPNPAYVLMMGAMPGSRLPHRLQQPPGGTGRATAVPANRHSYARLRPRASAHTSP